MGNIRKYAGEGSLNTGGRYGGLVVAAPIKTLPAVPKRDTDNISTTYMNPIML